MYYLFWTITVRSSATPKVVPSSSPLGIEHDHTYVSTPSPPHTPVLKNDQLKVPKTPESTNMNANESTDHP